MTISSTVRRAGPFAGNGVATSFPFTFKVFDKTDLQVVVTDSLGGNTTLVLDSDYSVTLNLDQNSTPGGSISYPKVGSPLSTGSELTAIGSLDNSQPTDLTNNGGFYPKVIEDMADRLTILVQQLAEQATRTLTVPLAATQPDLMLPIAPSRANKLVGFDVNGDAITYNITASVGAGNLTVEGPFVAGNEFTPGVTTALALSQAYGTVANVQVHFDGVYQGPDQYTLNGNQIIFASPIPVGVNKVYIIGGTTLSIGIPANGTVGDRQLAWGNILSRVVDNVAAVSNLNVGTYTRVFATGYYAVGDGGGGSYFYSSSSTATVNGGTVLAAAGGVGRWILQTSGRVSVLQFGAIPNDTTSTANAQINREAFRRACLSYATDWSAAQTAGTSRTVYVPPGDWNLANGFTVPPGVSLIGDGVGTRLAIFGATADTTGVLPLVSMGRVINGTVTQVATGVFAPNPAPYIDGLWLNPQNGNTALDVTGVPGFLIGKLWLQASIGLHIGDASSDGMIDTIVVDSGTLQAVVFGNCQNIMFNQIYTYTSYFSLTFTADSGTAGANNIDIGLLQTNYTQFAPIQTVAGINVGRVRINDFVCNQNGQYSTFYAPVFLNGASIDLSIGNFDARNYNGAAYNNNSGSTGNSLSIDRAFLRQTPNNPSYSLGTTADGFRVNGGSLTVGFIDAAGLNGSPFYVLGSAKTTLRVKGGVIGPLVNPFNIVNISNTNTNSIIELDNIENNSPPCPLFNAQAAISPRWRNCKNPFPVLVEGGRNAVHIPFIGEASLFEVNIAANTNYPGSGNYRRVIQVFAAQETSYNGALATYATLANSFLSGVIGTGTVTPNISPQLDINSVGGGSQVSFISYGTLVISVPTASYANVTFDIKQLLAG